MEANARVKSSTEHKEHENCYLYWARLFKDAILDKKCCQFCTLLPSERLSRYGPSPCHHPGQSCLVGFRNDPDLLQRCGFFFKCGGGGGGGGQGGVFVVVSAFKSFILNLDKVMSICPNIFLQDSGLR